MTVRPGRLWRWLRRLSQCLALAAILAAPFLGGWQRLDRAEMAVWDDSGWNLPDWLRDSLPLGDSPGRAYDWLFLLGGGSAAEYAGIPAVDPVAGMALLLRGQFSPRFILALAIPVLLAVLGGRLFCGWLCPFGFVSRGIEAIVERLPWRRSKRRQRRAIPRQRPVRWVILIGSIAASALGVHIVLLLFLPHLLLQQTLYSVWLLGGGGFLLGLFLGLVVAGIAIGPTVYCATLCPTGAALSLLGRKKMINLGLAEPTQCGAHCGMCDSACWLQLHPASGDPGPDCDTCGRCVTVCPQTNMHVVIGRRKSQGQKPGPRRLPMATAALIAATGLVAGSHHARADSMVKPRLILEGGIQRDEVTLAVSIVDQRGVKLDPDARQQLSGVEISVYVSRRQGEFYRGPLVVRVGDHALSFAEPSAPRSTPTRSIYRRVLQAHVGPATTVVIEPIAGWLDEPATWRIPGQGTSLPWTAMVEVTVGAGLFFAGLLALALVRRPHE